MLPLNNDCYITDVILSWQNEFVNRKPERFCVRVTKLFFMIIFIRSVYKTYLFKIVEVVANYIVYI